MKTSPIFFLFVAIFLSPAIVAGNFDEHPFFKALVGNWKGAGELVAGDGTTIKITETWEGKANSDGTFSIIGERESGDDKKSFKWVYSYNSTTELYECEYSHTGMENPLRMDVSISDKKAVLVTSLGDSGGELVVTSSLVGKTLEGDVVVKDGSGQERLKGKVVHSRVKAK